MRYQVLRAIVLPAILLSAASTANAQLFGPRQNGMFGSRQGNAQERVSVANELAGTLTGSERFLRGNRTVRDFVGADARDMQSFIGGQSAAPRSVRPAALDVRPPRITDVNRTDVRSRAGQRSMPYPPRLHVDFSYDALEPATVQTELSRRIEAADQVRRLGEIQVRVEGRTAILEGEVASAANRALAEQLVRLEPGVSEVRNGLTVADSPAGRE